jgi:hypothetical protein
MFQIKGKKREKIVEWVFVRSPREWEKNDGNCHEGYWGC